MNKKILFLFILLAALVSCEDNREADMVDDTIYFSRDGIMEKSAYAYGQGWEELEVTAIRGGLNNSPGLVAISEDWSLLNNYNDGKMPEAWLELLPENCYRIKERKLEISGEEGKARFIIEYNMDSIVKTGGYGIRYMLPLHIKSSGIDLLEDKSNVMFVFNAIEARIFFTDVTRQNFVLKKDETGFYSFTLPIRTDFENEWDITLQIAGNNQELVDALNATDPEQKGYQLLPAEAYTIEPASAVLASGENRTSIGVKVDKSKIAFGAWVLPVEIASASQFDLVPEARYMYATFINAGGVIGFRETGEEQITVDKSVATYSKKLHIFPDFELTGDVTLTVKGDNQSLVDKYNAANKTDYQLIPAGAYTITNNAVLTAGSTETEVSIDIDRSLIPVGVSLLPVEITKASGIYTVDPENSVYYYVLSNPGTWFTTAEQKAGWKILNASSYHSDGGTCLPKGIIDGLTGANTPYWQINYNNADLFTGEGNDKPLKTDKPQWVIIDLGKVMDISSLKWTHREGHTSNMKFEIYGATEAPNASINVPALPSAPSIGTYNGAYNINEPIWHKVVEFNNGGAQKTVAFDQATARYIQIRMVVGYRPSCMGEIDFFGLEK